MASFLFYFFFLPWRSKPSKITSFPVFQKKLSFSFWRNLASKIKRLLYIHIATLLCSTVPSDWQGFITSLSLALFLFLQKHSCFCPDSKFANCFQVRNISEGISLIFSEVVGFFSILLFLFLFFVFWFLGFVKRQEQQQLRRWQLRCRLESSVLLHRRRRRSK